MEEREIKFIDPNIARKNKFLDGYLTEQKNDKVLPLFSMIEFNLSGLCTRQCVFCPRSDPKAFPNINEHISERLYEKVMADLQKANWNGVILYSAFSEPLLHRNIEELVGLSKKYLPLAHVEAVTNGDLATLEKISNLFAAGLTVLSISMYDGPHQVKHFRELQKEAGLRDDQLMLRARWLPPEEHFGITLSNRAGALNLKEIGVTALKEPLKKNCFYPFYQTLIDYDGSVLLCCHDWGKKLIVGNIKSQSIIDIWNNNVLKRVRMNLAQANRNFPPCNLCDTPGELVGRRHFEKIIKFYGKQQTTEK